MRIFKKEKVPVPQGITSVPLDSLTGPFDLEIGCGQGLHALNRVKKFKNRQLIAIEKTRQRFQQFHQFFEEQNRPRNLWPLHTNAVWWLSHYGREDMFENIFLLYPNPYPKKRHSHLRWINRPFMPYLLTLLKPGGILEMRTNRKIYYLEFKEKMEFFKCMSVKKDCVVSREDEVKTAFEKKYLAKGERCYILEFVKTAGTE